MVTVNPNEFVGDKETIVDVKATDDAGHVYQIELQVRIAKTLPERILYTWAHVYHGQIGKKKPYGLLKPACSIWILEGTLFRDEPGFHHRFTVMAPRTQRVLSPQLDIHVLELRKLEPLRLAAARMKLDAEARWLYFLKEGGRMAALPAALQSPEMSKAMSVLERFSDAKRDLALYQSRSDFLHVQRTLEVEDEEKAKEKARLEAENSRLETEMNKLEAEKSRAEEREAQALATVEHERAEKAHAEAGKAQAEAGKAQAEAKLERLRELLLAAGIDPDASSN